METGARAGPLGLGGFCLESDGDPQGGFEKRRNMVRFTF